MTSTIESLLNRAIPDEKVLDDLWKILKKDEPQVELSESWVEIPKAAKIDIVTKAYFHELFPKVGFGTYKVLLALGGFNQNENGFHSAGICFSTMYYGEGSQLITLDFHEEFR